MPSSLARLSDRLATGLRQLHRLFFEFSRRDFLNLCQADPFPDLLEYISALGTLPNRGKVRNDGNYLVQSMNEWGPPGPLPGECPGHEVAQDLI